MSRKFKCFSTLTMLAALVFVASTVKADTAGRVTFKFNPPDGTKYVERLKVTGTIDMPFIGKMTVAEIAKTHVEVKKTPDGFTLSTVPISLDYRINGQPVDNTEVAYMQALAKKAAINYIINSEGRLLRIDGLEPFFDELRKTVASENPTATAEFEGMLPALRQGILEEIKKDYDDRVGSYIGRSMEPNELWQSYEKVQAYAGSVTVKQRTRFVEHTKRDGHDCIKLRFYFAADPNAVTSEIMQSINDAAEMYCGKKSQMPKVVSAEITGTGERYVDPNTLLIFAETMTTTVNVVMSVPGEGKVSLSSEEKREYSYEYSIPKQESPASVEQTVNEPSPAEQPAEQPAATAGTDSALPPPP